MRVQFRMKTDPGQNKEGVKWFKFRMQNGCKRIQFMTSNAITSIEFLGIGDCDEMSGLAAAL